ncbi:MAG: minichromosome maintenance protein MCM [Nanoarchaeota archaeon]|nr:minichromosome maintenance protein MCM [Nanoarchaeota archaeon]MBU1705060.1 minichromosome maintenance protein MCM [Nanoarchaeota archaeon]
MEADEQIKQFIEFVESNYLEDLLKANQKGLKYIVIDFSALSKFNPELAGLLLDQPEETIKACELALEHFDVQGFKVRIKNLPEAQSIMIRNIRSSHINRLFSIDGVVRQKSDVRPQVTSAKFECPSCGNIINVLQLDSAFKEPSRCGCGRKGKFRLVSKELVDAQGIVLEEAAEDLEGGEQPKRMNIFLKDDLVSPLSEKKTSPGSKIGIIGVIKEVPIILRTGAKSTRFDLLIEANHVEPKEENFLQLDISEEEEELIKELARDPEVYQKMAASIAPSIYGHERIKEALVLQLMGGSQKMRKDGVRSRGDIHILLVGDPGAGKSALIKRMARIAPKARYVSGKGVSAAGLTASVVKDEFLKGWSLEAGAMVLASNGICCIDEMDKIGPEDRAAMHEAMENQTVSISKANIQATMIARTTVLAAANPKFGRFDPYAIVGEQIDLPPTLINRFDLIFPIKDLPDAIKDEKLASHILGLHKDPMSEEPPVSTELLRKFVAYAKRTSPELTDDAIKEIKEYYIMMRTKGQGEGGIKSVPISARQLEALVRLSEASARVRLSDKVTKKDAKMAIDLVNFCLIQVGLDPETGKIDIDRISTGISASQRSHIVTIKQIITELETKIGKTIPIDDIVAAAKEKGVEEEKVEEIIQKLKRSGDLFEPRRGFISKI